MKPPFQTALVLIVGVLFGLSTKPAFGQTTTSDTSKRSIVAFFAIDHPNTRISDAENESLADFQLSAKQIRPKLEASGIQLDEVYARTIRMHNGRATVTFHPRRNSVGYYLVAPGNSRESNMES